MLDSTAVQTVSAPPVMLRRLADSDTGRPDICCRRFEANIRKICLYYGWLGDTSKTRDTHENSARVGRC